MKQKDKMMKKVLLTLLTVGTVTLMILDVGVPILLYLNLPTLLFAFAGFYIWAASGEGNLSSSANIRRGADGAVLLSWISVLIGLVAVLASVDPSDAEGLYVSLALVFLQLVYGYTIKFVASIFTD